MSPANRAMLGIRRAIFAGSPYSPQSYNGFLGGVSFNSVFNLPQMRTIKEASGDMLGGVGDTAKSAVTGAKSAVSGAKEIGRSAMESAGATGEKAMHTADRTVNSAAESTKKISDKMIIEAEDKVEEETTHQPTDSSVEDVRTREQGYD